MSEYALNMRNQLVGLAGIVERNVYLTKRYFLWDLAFMVWTIANTLTIVFIARAAHLPPAKENTLATALLVGATIWAFLGIIFEFVTETVAWERWEGTIEYTFMAPLSRFVHLGGQGVFAVLYGMIRATILLCTHDMAEAEALSDRVGILDRGRLLFLEPVADVKRRFGVETLEQAFFAATGREFENEATEDDDEYREVFA